MPRAVSVNVSVFADSVEIDRLLVAQGEELRAFRKYARQISAVVAFPLDPLVENYRPPLPVCVLKIDTQGHELPALRSANAFLTNQVHRLNAALSCYQAAELAAGAREEGEADLGQGGEEVTQVTINRSLKVPSQSAVTRDK